VNDQTRVDKRIQVGLHVVEIHGGELHESGNSVDLKASPSDAFNVDYAGEFLPGDFPLRSVTAHVLLESDRTWFLGNNRQMMELSSSATPLWPAGRFIVTERQGMLDRWEFPRFGQLRISKQHQSVSIVATLLDRSSCGLSAWPDAVWAPRRDKIDLQIARASLNRLDECAWIEPYPDGAGAAVCLTDHADFDSPEKAQLIADNFIRRDLYMTKTVFPAADLPASTRWEPTGLDKPLYRTSIDRLFEHGSEIALHGFTPRRDAPPLSECKRRLDLLRDYRLTTWIDHGTGDYLFSRGGRMTEGVNLESLLEPSGVRNYWSYFDLWDNPFGKNPSLLSKRFSLDVISDLMDGSQWLDEVDGTPGGVVRAS
jgi:hypothetical protein